MTEEEFNNIVNRRCLKIKEILTIKSKEYRRNNNPLHNFEEGAKINNQTSARVLDGFLTKHIISYKDMLNDIDKGEKIDVELINEKFGDIINYFILQEALIKGTYSKEPIKKKLIVNRAYCCFCGDFIYSMNRHDFQLCKCKNSSVDGGLEYIKISGKYCKSIPLYNTDSFEDIRKGFRRWNTKNLEWTCLFKISDKWLNSIIEYYENHKEAEEILEYYRKELEYRKKHNIKVNESKNKKTTP